MLCADARPHVIEKPGDAREVVRAIHRADEQQRRRAGRDGGRRIRVGGDGRGQRQQEQRMRRRTREPASARSPSEMARMRSWRRQSAGSNSAKSRRHRFGPQALEAARVGRLLLPHEPVHVLGAKRRRAAGAGQAGRRQSGWFRCGRDRAVARAAPVWRRGAVRGNCAPAPGAAIPAGNGDAAS